MDPAPPPPPHLWVPGRNPGIRMPNPSSLHGKPSLPFPHRADTQPTPWCWLPPPPPFHHQPANINNNPCNSLCFYSLAFLAPALLISAPPAPKCLLKLLESGDLCKCSAPGCPCLPLRAGTHTGDGSTHVPCRELGAIRPGYLKGARLGLIKTK